MDVTSIAYHGGACGDFVRLLLITGDKNVDSFLISNDGYISICLTNNTWLYNVCMLEKSSGAIRPKQNLNHITDINRNLFTHKFNQHNFDDIQTISKLIQNENETTWHLHNSLVVGHEYQAVIDAKKSLEFYYEYIALFDVQRVLYITLTNKTSVDMLNRNIVAKNNIPSAFTLERTMFEQTIIERDMKSDDFMLELSDIYEKATLREFLLNNFVWDDSNFDEVYDLYMSYQP